MELAYYPGCTVKSTAKNFEISAIASAKVLDIEFIELPRWTCCGTVFSLASDDVMHQVAPIRNLLRVQEMKKDRVVTLCSMCYNTLKRSNLLVKKNKEVLDKINNYMYEEPEKYQAGVEVVHFLEVLDQDVGFEKIKQFVKKPLKGLKVVPYYGCTLLRPRDVGIDDAESPTIMEKLLKALGAEVINDPMKTECCGAYHTVERKHIIKERTYKIISSAVARGGEALVLSCPLCDYNLDKFQMDVAREHPGFHPIPVFYFTQLMALAFGLDESALGLEYNYTDPKPLLLEKNLLGAGSE